MKIKKTTRIKKLEWIVIYLIRRLIGFLFDWWDYFFLQHWSFLLWSVIYLFLEANCCFWLDLWITFLALIEEEEEIEMLLENYLQRYSYHFQQTICFFLVLSLFLAVSHYHLGLLRSCPYFEPQLRFYPHFLPLCVFTSAFPKRRLRLPLLREQ